MCVHATVVGSIPPRGNKIFFSPVTKQGAALSFTQSTHCVLNSEEHSVLALRFLCRPNVRNTARSEKNKIN